MIIRCGRASIVLLRSKRNHRRRLIPNVAKRRIMDFSGSPFWIAVKQGENPSVGSTHVFVSALLMVLGCFQFVSADEPDNRKPRDQGTLEFRRLFVPEGRIKEVIGDQEYAAYERDKFERLVNELRYPSQSRPPAVVATLATYEARFDGQSLVDGTAQLNLRCVSGDNATYSLQQCNLAIGKPSWKNRPGREVRLGTTGDGDRVLFIDESGTVSFGWSARGAEQENGDVYFSLMLPRSTSSQLDLRVPDTCIPHSSDATVRELEKDSTAGTRLWRLVVNSSSQVVVTMMRQDGERSSHPAATVRRKDLTYSFDRTLVRLLAEIHFDVDNRPLRQMSFRVSAPLGIRAVRLGKSELEFATALTSSGETVVTVEFPQPVFGIDRRLLVDAAMPPLLDQPWELPSLVVEDSIWQEGSTTLELDAPLTLDQLKLDECLQTGVKPLPDPPGRVVELQQLGPNATVTVVLGHHPPSAAYAGASEIRVLDDELRASCVLDFSTTAGTIFELPAEVARPWIVDSVRAAELGPAGSETSGKQAAKIPLQWELQKSGGRKQMLTILLRKSVRPDRTVRIQLQAHRSRPQPGETISIEQMQVVAPLEVTRRQHLIALYGQSPYRFELSSENEISWFDPAEANARQQTLLSAEAGGLFFRRTADSHDTVAYLTQSASRFKARLQVKTTIRKDSLDELFRLRCEPGNLISKVRVALTGSRDDDIRWSLEGGGERGVTARRLRKGRQPAGEAAMDEQVAVQWELTLTRPRDVPFTIVGRRQSKSTGDAIVSLPWMREATSQEGTLVLSSGDGTQFDVEHPDLTPFPLPGLPPNRFTGSRAAYRYRPADLPIVRIVRRNTKQKTASGWAWSCNLRSRFADGKAFHSASYRIENVGLQRVSLKLPEDATLRQVLVDGRAVNVASISGSQDEFALPSGVSYPTVTVNFTNHQSLPEIAGKRAACFPQLSIPVLRSYWTVWVPPAASCVSDDRGFASSLPNTLAKRLLGPLVREPDQDPFSLSFTRSTWEDLVGQGDDGSVKTLQQVFETLAAIRTSDMNWSQLLENYDQLVKQDGATPPLPPLLVDRRSFQRLGIAADQPLVTSEESGFEAVLDRSGLAVLLIDGRVVLVSQQWLSSQRAFLRASHSPLAWISDGRSRLSGKLLLMPARQWIDSAERTPHPWPASDRSAESELFRAGWTAVEFELAPDKNFTVQVVRPTRILALAWSVFFFAVGLAWWLMVKTPKLLFFAAMVAGTAAMTVPEHFSAIATACLLGLFVGAAIGVVSGRVTLVSVKRTGLLIQEGAVSHNSAVPTALLLVACAAYFLIARPARTDDLPEGNREMPTRENGKIYSVIIPVDKDQRPADDTVYVPGEFSHALLNLSAKRNASSQPWLLRAAEYELRLNWKGVKTELGATDLIATYDLDVSNHSRQVKLPLSREQLHVIPERSRLNGKPVQVDWAADGSGLTLDVGSSGSHVLELAFQPVTTLDEQVTRTTIRIPQIHRSMLRVQYPDGATGTGVPDSLGAVVRNREARTITAALGPLDRISLDWPRNGIGESPANRVSASQISWLTIDQGSVVMRTKFRFATAGGLLEEVAIKTDPRLQMRLRPDQPVEIAQDSKVDHGATRITTFRRTNPADSEMSLDVTFSVPGTSGIGNVPLPRVRAVADESVNCWLAISMGAGLQLANEFPADTRPIPAEDFLDEWGSREPDQAVPDVTMLLEEGRKPVQLAVYPRPIDVQATETLRVGLDLDSATVQYRAEVHVLRGDVFRLQLRVPKPLRISDVQLTADGQSVSANWKRTADEFVVVKADAPLPALATLLLSGDVNISRAKNVALPNVAFESIPVSKKVLEVYRRPSADILLTRKKAWREIEADGIGTLDRSLGRLVAVLEPVPADSLGQVKLPTATVRPNDPQPSYQLVSVASRADGQWWAEIVCRLYGFKGKVDTLRLDIPSSWNEPITAEGASVLRVTAPGSDRSQLLVQPLHPLTDGGTVRLRGRLSGSPKEMPDIYVTGRRANMVERFVALQIESANQKTEWQTAGLREAVWPETVSDQVALPKGPHLLYRVVGQRYRARVGNMGPVAGVPQVRLVDVHLDQSEHSYSCVASFDLEPAGLHQCVIQLPSATQLLYASVAGQPAISSALSNNRWKVRLSHEQLPQRIEVLFTGKWPVVGHRSGASQSLPLPHVVRVPVERTLVTMTGDDRQRRWNLEGAEIAPLRQERFRLHSMTTLIDLSRTIARDQIPEDRRRWFVPWARRMVVSRRRIDAYRSQSAKDDKSLDVELSDIANSQLEAAEDLHTAGLLNEQLRSADIQPDLVGAEQASRVLRDRASRMVAKGRLFEVKVSALPTGRRPLWQRLAIVAAFPFVCLILYFLFTRGPFREWFVQWLYVFGVVLGMFWWLLLTPSVVGLFIVAVSLVAALRSHGSRVSGLRRRKRAT